MTFRKENPLIEVDEPKTPDVDREDVDREIPSTLMAT